MFQLHILQGKFLHNSEVKYQLIFGCIMIKTSSLSNLLIILVVFATTNIYSQNFTEVTTQFPGFSGGSFNWGDYNNDGLLDLMMIGTTGNQAESVFKLYLNKGGGSFEEVTTPVINLPWSSCMWGDYNNDGLLDILENGNDPENTGLQLLFTNKGDGTFANKVIPTLGASHGNVAWGDYNNDGLLDFVIVGSNMNGLSSRIFKQTADHQFVDINAGLKGINWGSAAWGDYDNDGWLDLAMIGNKTAYVYKNNGDDKFTETSIKLPGLTLCALTWGDYNGDGWLDLLITGGDSDYKTYVYQNNQKGGFEEKKFNLTGFGFGSSVVWADLDNDGDLDIVMTGATANFPVYTPSTKIYYYQDNNYVQSTDNLEGGYYSALSVGDYDNDDDLDIILSGMTAAGNRITKLYRNKLITHPSTPPRPDNLDYLINGKSIQLKWDKVSENKVPSDCQYYNVVIGSAPDKMDILSPMSDLVTGQRRVVQIGNAGTNNFKLIQGLKDGIYYWSVQSISATFLGSRFSPVDSFSVGKVLMAPVLTFPPNGRTGIGTLTNFTWKARPGASSYSIQISLNTDFTSNILEDSLIQTNNYQLVNPLPQNTPVFWRVRSAGPESVSPWSAPFGFVTGQSTDISEDEKENEANIHIIMGAASDKISILLQSGSDSTTEVRIFNNLGTLVNRSSISGNDSELIEIDTRDLANGVYYLQVCSGRNFDTFKFIKY